MSERKRTVGILKSGRDGLGADQVILLEDNTLDEDGGLVRVFVPNRTFCEILEGGGSDRVFIVRFKGEKQYVVGEEDILKQYDASDRVVERQVVDPILDEEPTRATKLAYPELDQFIAEAIHAA